MREWQRMMTRLTKAAKSSRLGGCLHVISILEPNLAMMMNDKDDNDIR